MKAKGGRGQRSDNKFERISLTIEPSLKAQLDSRVEELRMTRSELIVLALQQFLHGDSDTDHTALGEFGITGIGNREETNHTDNIELHTTDDTGNINNQPQSKVMTELIKKLQSGYIITWSEKGSLHLIKGSEDIYVRPRDAKKLQELGYL